MAERLKPFSPDVVALQECRKPAGESMSTSILWSGSDPMQGVALIDYRASTIRLADIGELPGTVLVAHVDPFVVVNVWAQKDDGINYDTFVEQAVRQVKSALRSDAPLVVVGDFNSSPKVAKSPHHTLMKVMTNECAMVSAYHRHHRVETGCELHPTYFHQWKATAQCHIDYVFIPADATVESVEVGDFESWRESDHRPVVVDFEWSRI